jgi:hypothetical protein
MRTRPLLLAAAAVSVAAVAATAGYRAGHDRGLDAGRAQALDGIAASDLTFARLLGESSGASDRPSLAERCESTGNAMSLPRPECRDFAGPKAQPRSASTTRPVDVLARELGARLIRLADVDGSEPRLIVHVEKATKALAGRGQVSFVRDVNYDGLDDDGKVQVAAGGTVACVLLPASSAYSADVYPGDCDSTNAHRTFSGTGAAYGPKPFPPSYVSTL